MLRTNTSIRPSALRAVTTWLMYPPPIARVAIARVVGLRETLTLIDARSRCGERREQEECCVHRPNACATRRPHATSRECFRAVARDTTRGPTPSARRRRRAWPV